MARPKRKCSYCGDNHYAKGYCSRHYRRMLRGLPIDKDLRKKEIKPCKVCGKLEHEALGMCRSCYNKDYRKRNPKKPKYNQDDLEYICAFSNDLVTVAAGFGKSVEQIEKIIQQLKDNGKFEQYKKSYERKLEA